MSGEKMVVFTRTPNNQYLIPTHDTIVLNLNKKYVVWGNELFWRDNESFRYDEAGRTCKFNIQTPKSAKLHKCSLIVKWDNT